MTKRFTVHSALVVDGGEGLRLALEIRSGSDRLTDRGGSDQARFLHQADFGGGFDHAQLVNDLSEI